MKPRVPLVVLLLALPHLACHEAVSTASPRQGAPGTWLTPSEVKAANIEVATVGEHLLGQFVTTSGRVTFDDLRVAHIYSPVTGRVTRVHASLGERVKKGAALATIASPSVGQWSADLDKAQADFALASHDYQRKRDLLAVRAVARAEYDAAEDAFLQAKAERDRARQKAELLRGAGAATVSQGYLLTTPIDGQVISRQISPGMEIQGQYDSGSSGVELFTVGQLDRVWVLADVYEEDLGRVAVGAKVSVSVVARPGKVFLGTVDWVAGALDPATHTARVRCVFDNPADLLKPEMYATVQIAASEPHAALSIPRDAVVHMGDQAVVYTESAPAPDGRVRFELAPVGIDDTGEAYVRVDHGLEPGTLVVTRGAQALSSAL